MTRTLRYSKTDDEIGVVTFTTPDQLNSITEQRFDDLEQVITTIESDSDIRTLIITGEGRAFCVGLDLALLEKAFDDMGYFERTVRRLAAIIERIEALPIPTVAAVNGLARAGGFELTLSCDMMLIANEAKIGDVHTDSGVIPACATLRLSRRVGPQRAKELLWTARWLSGPQAVEYGLALRSTPAAQLPEEAIAFARSIADKPRPALTSLKTIFRKGETLHPMDGVQLELASFVDYMSKEPYGREGYYAFRESRKPVWRP